ncbi:MAG: MBL fold metallo-hydrolase [Candidatus Coproplasma sp.]
MKIHKIYPFGFASNTYILTADGKTCIVIDCAQPHVLDKCRELGLTPEYVLLTHCHYDHIGGCGALYQAGAKIICGKDEEDLIFSEDNRAIFHGITIPHFEISRTVRDGEELELCGIRIKVISTPGHTRGGVCYVVQDNIFSGDTLFFESVGRTDFSTGSASQLTRSVKKLYALAGDYKVYCGHGEDTTLNHERIYNPYINGNA